jgi:hypothetical protein
MFCSRISGAEKALDGEAASDNSLRASVFGVFDGVARWIFRLMNDGGQTDSDNCFAVGTLRKIAAGELLQDKKTVQEIVNKIGTIGLHSNDKICPWDPKLYKHEVPTLILNGDSDPVTAGKQAEYMYTEGLTPGKRAFVELIGAGHQMSPQVKPEMNACSCEEGFLNKLGTHFQAIVEIFLNNTNNVNGFLTNPNLSTHLGELNARLGP